MTLIFKTMRNQPFVDICDNLARFIFDFLFKIVYLEGKLMHVKIFILFNNNNNGHNHSHNHIYIRYDSISVNEQ